MTGNSLLYRSHYYTLHWPGENCDAAAIWKYDGNLVQSSFLCESHHPGPHQDVVEWCEGTNLQELSYTAQGRSNWQKMIDTAGIRRQQALNDLWWWCFACALDQRKCPPISCTDIWSNSCLDILMVRHFHVRHFQRPQLFVQEVFPTTYPLARIHQLRTNRRTNERTNEQQPCK